MTDAHTPAVLREDQGSLPAASRPSVPTAPLFDSFGNPSYALKAALERELRDFAEEIAAAERGKACTRKTRKHCAKGEASNRIIEVVRSLSPVENSPIPALGGTEAEGRSAPNPTPVRGLEPVAWATAKELAEVANDRSPLGRHLTIYRHPASGAHQPLYAASDVSALQGEVERLRAALEFIAEGRDVGRHDGLPEDGPAHDGDTMFFVARQALGEQQ